MKNRITQDDAWYNYGTVYESPKEEQAKELAKIGADGFTSSVLLKLCDTLIGYEPNGTHLGIFYTLLDELKKRDQCAD